MGLNVTSLSRNGLRDWLVQRVSAVIMAVYVFVLLGFLLWHWPLQYDTWRQLFSCNFMRIATLIVLLNVCLHAWVGMWTIFTDYIKCSCARLTLHVLVLLALFACFAWGVQILWGNS
jgi:succinate dehydrogenase / fumarate reductase membrane anchor subunit